MQKKIFTTFCLLAVIGFILPSLAWASQPNLATGSAISLSKIVNLTLSLLAVVVAILVFAYILRRMIFLRTGSSRLIHVISTLAIGNKERLLLIKVKNKLILTGITPNQISTLHVFEQDSSEDDEYSNTDQQSFNNTSTLMRIQRSLFKTKTS